MEKQIDEDEEEFDEEEYERWLAEEFDPDMRLYPDGDSSWDKVPDWQRFSIGGRWMVNPENVISVYAILMEVAGNELCVFPKSAYDQKVRELTMKFFDMIAELKDPEKES